jgi:hypothetical protein
VHQSGAQKVSDALACGAFLGYSLAGWESRRWPAYLVAASILLFAANVPFLWFAPRVAVVLMATSILVLASVPVHLARVATE